MYPSPEPQGHGTAAVPPKPVFFASLGARLFLLANKCTVWCNGHVVCDRKICGAIKKAFACKQIRQRTALTLGLKSQAAGKAEAARPWATVAIMATRGYISCGSMGNVNKKECSSHELARFPPSAIDNLFVATSPDIINQS